MTHTAGSTQATIYPTTQEDIQGSFLYIDDAWRKILTVSSNNEVTLDQAAVTTNTETVHVGKMNEITIAGDEMA